MNQTATNASDNADRGPMPMFFERPTPVDAKRHANAGLMPPADYRFAAETNSILINASEFVEAAKHYPIVLTQTEIPTPVAIMGLEKQNYFVDAKGEWLKGSYVPAYVRKYPFALTPGIEPNQVILCVDEALPQYQEEAESGAIRFYDAEGKASELTRNALDFCVNFDAQYRGTMQFCEGLKAAGLLTPAQSTSKLFNGREIKLGGFQSIDEQKLRDLPDATILDFVKKGWMPLIYFMLMSSTNWNRLADQAGQREPKAS